MSNIGDSMERKGYIPLMDGGSAAVGFRPSLSKPNRRLGTKVWFDIGGRMKDANGNTIKMTVAAHDEAEYNEYVKKGWVPMAPGESNIVEAAPAVPKNDEGSNPGGNQTPDAKSKPRGRKAKDEQTGA